MFLAVCSGASRPKPVYALLLLSSFTLTLILSQNLTQRPAVNP